MKGRVLGIKKSILLKITAIFSLLSFLSIMLFSCLWLKIPDLWFYSFFVILGIFEVIKSSLFKLDSSFYLGTLLTFIGLSGYTFWLTNSIAYAGYYIALSFILASVLTAMFCGQRFHLIIAYSVFFVTIFAYILGKSLITTPIFIAFITLFLVLLSVGIIFGIKRRR